MTISPDTTAGELASQFPQTIRIFHQLRIEFCCEGQRSLGDLCRDSQLSFEEVAGALARAAAAPAPLPRPDWTTRPLSELTAHIVESFHQPLRQELPRLQRMAVKVQRHRDPYKHVLAVVLHELERFAADLEPHMATAEQDFFPLICRVEAGRSQPGDRAQFRRMCAEAEAANVETGLALKIVRNVTDRYAAPANACATLRGLYEGLSDLDRLMRLFVHLENNLLFPRATALLSDAFVV
jgi:regulator of cell morphogenesis and NO signaling